MGEMADYYRDEELLHQFYGRPIMARAKKKRKYVKRDPQGWVNEGLADARRRRKKRKYVRREVAPPPPEPVVKDYSTIGVRFIYGKDPGKVFTYRVSRLASSTPYLGQALVADTPLGMRVVVVVEVHNEPRDTDPDIEYKFIAKRVTDL